MLYSHDGEYPKEIPERIRLSDRSTRTDSSTYTKEEIEDAGYVFVESPVLKDNETALWNLELRKFEIKKIKDDPDISNEVGSGVEPLPVAAIVPPEIDIKTEKLIWDQNVWFIHKLSAWETQVRRDKHAEEIVLRRNESLRCIAWRVDRYLSEVRQGLKPTNNIVEVDKYIQALRDIPNQEGFPFDVVWPEAHFEDRPFQNPPVYNTQDDGDNWQGK